MHLKVVDISLRPEYLMAPEMLALSSIVLGRTDRLDNLLQGTIIRDPKQRQNVADQELQSQTYPP